MARAGINRHTGRPLVGFDHVVQSIAVIFATVLGQRVMVRDFGGAGPVIIGRSLTRDNIVTFFSMVTISLEKWEPCFKITLIQCLNLSPETVRQGKLTFRIEGEYRPRGHLGDFRSEGPVRVLSIGSSETAPIQVTEI